MTDNQFDTLCRLIAAGFRAVVCAMWWPKEESAGSIIDYQEIDAVHVDAVLRRVREEDRNG